MKNKFCVIILLLCIFVFSSGFKYSGNMIITNLDLMSYQFEYGISDALIDKIKENNPTFSLSNLDSIMKNKIYENKEIDTSEGGYTYVSYYTAQKLTELENLASTKFNLLDVDNLDLYSNQIFQVSNHLFYKTYKANFIINYNDALLEEIEKYQSESDEENEVTFNVTVPNIFINSNATSIKTNNASWDLSKMTPDEDGNYNITFEFMTYKTAPIIIFGLLGFILILIIFIKIISKFTHPKNNTVEKNDNVFVNSGNVDLSTSESMIIDNQNIVNNSNVVELNNTQNFNVIDSDNIQNTEGDMVAIQQQQPVNPYAELITPEVVHNDNEKVSSLGDLFSDAEKDDIDLNVETFSQNASEPIAEGTVFDDNVGLAFNAAPTGSVEALSVDELKEQGKYQEVKNESAIVSDTPNSSLEAFGFTPTGSLEAKSIEEANTQVSDVIQPQVVADANNSVSSKNNEENL